MSSTFQFFVVKRGEDKWFVGLPHQCDSWEIAGGNYEDATWKEAVADTELFIAEAQMALQALIERREHGNEYAFYE